VLGIAEVTITTEKKMINGGGVAVICARVHAVRLAETVHHLDRPFSW
jgi:hypothetical protein